MTGVALPRRGRPGRRAVPLGTGVPPGASAVKCERLRPGPVADLDAGGGPGSDRQSHEVSNKSKGLDHNGQL